MELDNEKLIKRFLYGELPEEERFEFEERFISEADLFEEIQIVEDELIEKYVRGWMVSAEGEKFEKHFLTTNKRRERVQFSRQLIKKLEEGKQAAAISLKKHAGAVVEDISIWEKLAAIFMAPKTAMAGAFVIAIAVIGSWFLFQNLFTGTPEFVKNEGNVNVKTAPEIIVPKPSASLVESNANVQNNSLIEKENSNVEESLPKPTEKNAVQEQTKTPDKPDNKSVKRPIPNPVLALFAGTLRSGGKNNVLNLAEEAKAATLQLNLENTGHNIFQAQLTDVDGNVLFQQGNLKHRRSIVTFTIPSEYLKRGDYVIKLNGKNASGEKESVADFQFRVEK